MEQRVIVQFLLEDICGLFNLICGAYILVGQKVNTRRCVLMLEFLGAATLQLFADAFAWQFRGNPTNMGWYMVRISNYLVFVSNFIMVYLGTRYIEQFVKKKGAKLNKGWKMTIYSLCVIGIGLITLSQFTGLLYTFDAQNFYHRADYFWVISVMSSMLLVILFVMTLCYRKYMRAIEYGPLLFLAAVPFVTSLIQLFYYGLSLNTLGIGAAVIIMFLCYETERSQMLVNQKYQLMEQKIEMAQHRQQLAEQKIEMAQHRQQLAEQKNLIMLSQIRPHFIFNTLASIEAMCDVDPKMARKAIHKFSKYLRMNMGSLTEAGLVPFKKELDYLEAYLWIEKMRFEERLDIQYDLQFKDFELPSLTLQPIVENAVKHGVCALPEGGTVKISSWKEGDEIVLQVEDNGAGFDVDAINNDGKPHIGIKNVKERIQALCGGTLTVQSKPQEGTTVQIRWIPSENTSV